MNRTPHGSDRRIKVLAIDDHALLREAIAALVKAESDIELVA